MKGKTKQRVMAVVLTLAMTIGLLPLGFLGGVTQVQAAGTPYSLSVDMFKAGGLYADKTDGSADSYIQAGVYSSVFEFGASKEADAGKWRAPKNDGIDSGKSGNLTVKYTVLDASATATLTVVAGPSGIGTATYQLLDTDGAVVALNDGSDDLVTSAADTQFVWENLTADKSPYTLKMKSGSAKKICIQSMEAVETSAGGTPSAITAPTPDSLNAVQNDAADLSKVTITGTGTAGGEGSYYVVKKVGSDAKETEKKVAGNATTFEVEDTLDASGKYTYTVYGLGKDVDGKEVKDESFTNSVEIEYVLPLGTAKPTAVPGNASVKLSWSEVKEATSYDVKVYQNGTELADKSVTGVTDLSVTFEGLTNGTEYGFVVVTNRSTTVKDNQTTSEEVKAAPKAPEVGVTWFNANDLPAGTVSSNYVVNDNVTLTAKSGKTMTVQSASVTATDGQVFSQRLSTGGSGDVADMTAPGRTVQLTLKEKSYIVIYAQSSGASRPLVLADGDGKKLDEMALAGKDDPVAPSRAITLEPGTYHLYTTGGTGYIFGVKIGAGEAPRAAWSTVEKPVINSVTRGEDGNLTVDFTANIGTDGADKAYVIMYKDGFEAGSKEVGSDADVKFAPQENGEYTFKVIICRDGEADKESDVYTLAGYELPPAVPAITWVNNLGNGSVYVDYNNIPAACDVWYKSDADADYIKAAEGVTAGNYTFTGLTAGEKYDFKVTATDAKGTSTSEFKGFVVGEPVQQWYADVFGSATSGTMTINDEVRSLKSPGANYTYPAAAPDVTNGNNGKIGIAASSNGKVADSEEGIQIYYTKINPNTENFKMTATFTVTDDSTVNNQSAFAIFAIDAQGVGTKDTKYFNSVSVGSFKTAGTQICPETGKNWYHANSARLITGYESYDTSSTAGSGRNMDNDNLFSKQPAGDTSKNGDTYTYTLEKTNTGFICSMEGGGEPIVFDDVHNVMVQEDGSIVVGVAAARVGVEITNIQFEKTAGGAEAVKVSNLIEPKVKVYSGTVSGTLDYEFIAGADVDGWLDVFNFATNEYVYQGPLKADGIVKVPVTLKSGYNDIKYAFKADEKIPDLTTYAIVENTHTVTVQQWGAEGETIYTAPNASTGGAGTREEPLDLQTALNHAQPGQTIVMLDGTYYIEKDLIVQRSANGTADKPITLTAENVGNVIVDGSKMEKSSSLITLVGDYWHMYGIEFQNGLGKGISVCGNYNTVEMCKIHHVANTGLQISRYAGEPNTDDMWPSYNLIKYCEAYDCSDPGRSDADGFAAKLTSGVGNKFYGCISHHNIDDGWDLYAKSTTGSIGAVTIENCVAYSNGFLSTDDPSTMSANDFGEGNGFKLGGENMPGAHVLKNCISYNNAGKGITSNSGPDVQVLNCTAYNNSLKGKAYNVSLYTKTSNPKAWVLDGMLSIAENGITAAELGSSNGVINSLRSATNYLYDGNKSVNTQGVEATSALFVSTDITLVPTITLNGIDMHGLLELKDLSWNAGAKFTSWEASAKPEATKTVSTKNVISFVGFNSVALGQAGSVNTGDATPITMLVVLMVISAGICGVYVFRRRKSF